MDTTHIALHVDRKLPLSADALFAALLDEHILSRFMFGPPLADDQIRGLALDAGVGGSFAFAICRRGSDLVHTGTFLEIDPVAHRLAFTWGIADQPRATDSRVVIDIEPAALRRADGMASLGCQVVVTHHLHTQWAMMARHTEACWSAFLETLGAQLHPATAVAEAVVAF